MGEAFTAKDFRTWAGTVLATAFLARLEPFESDAEAKRNVDGAVRYVSSRLGNTPAVCRRSYIHPRVIGLYLDGKLEGSEVAKVPEGLRPEEALVLSLLRRRRSKATQ
jgi:DNA topoisomerase-1